MTTPLYEDISACRACSGTDFTVLRAFSDVLPAGLYTDTPIQERLPLTLLQCTGCGHVQLREKISTSIYQDYIYFTPPESGLSGYLEGLAGELCERFELEGKRILEIGSSDGAFLALLASGNEVLGIEPSVELAARARESSGVETLQGYLGELPGQGEFDFILCRHVLEHINDLDAFTNAVIEHCRSGTQFLVEVPSFDRTIASHAYSNVFHEHVNYFYRDVLIRYLGDRGFRTLHEYENDIHGGSIGIVFEYAGSAVVNDAVGLTPAAALFENFDDYLKTVRGLLRKGPWIGYGAAHRSFTLLSLLGLIDDIDYIVDQNPGYRGKYLGGTGIRVEAPERLLRERGREILVLATSYEREILAANVESLRHNTFICLGEQPRRVRHNDLVASRVREHVLRMKHRSGSSHSGSALSISDILVVLYFAVMNIEPARPDKPDRDRFILSKGHASAAFYSVLAERGFFDTVLLDGFFRNNGTLPGHVDMTAAPGIEASSGSLGHGLSLGLGMALAMRHDAPGRRCFVLCGDGEMDEGSVWEAIMYAPRKGLDNLVLIVDQNRLQGYPLDGEDRAAPLRERLESFGWHAVDVDGHDHEALEAALRLQPGRPLALVARTIKGRGVSFMENQFVWHYKSPDAEQLALALQKLI